jgi:glycosyltransferase involved in cell wall biosynthesis
VRIALSLLSLRPGQVGGAETYVRALVRRLPEVAHEDELLLVLDRDLDAEVAGPGWSKVVMPYGARSLVVRRVLEAYTPWRDAASERILASVRPDVTLFPQQSIFPHRAPGPAVVTVGDVQHLFHPENFGWFDRTFRPRAYPRSMERSARLIAVSEFTRRTLMTRFGIEAERIVSIHHGIDPAPAALEGDAGAPCPVDGPFLYCPAATWRHKGHAELLRTFAALRQGGRLQDRLVLTGQRTPLWERELVPLVRRLGIEHDVVHLGFVPRSTVDALMHHARAVVFPTRYEGFGVPVIEAAAAGARIVASRLEVFDEIGLPAENQVDFGDPAQVATALERPAPTRLTRDPLTWTEVASRTLEVLHRAAARSAA